MKPIWYIIIGVLTLGILTLIWDYFKKNGMISTGTDIDGIPPGTIVSTGLVPGVPPVALYSGGTNGPHTDITLPYFKDYDANGIGYIVDNYATALNYFNTSLHGGLYEMLIGETSDPSQTWTKTPVESDFAVAVWQWFLGGGNGTGVCIPPTPQTSGFWKAIEGIAPSLLGAAANAIAPGSGIIVSAIASGLIPNGSKTSGGAVHRIELITKFESKYNFPLQSMYP
jgi:hypothetical protein